MNLRESIKRILEDEIKVPLIVRRNVDFDLLDKEFNIALDVASERFREKKSKLKAMTPEKFGILVTSNLMVELCHKYENLCMDDTGLYDTIWEFINKYYFKQTTERFYDIVFGEINESVLKEETTDVEDFLYTEFDTIFDNLRLDIEYDERFTSTFYGKWKDEKGKTIFSRNDWGTFWIHKCKPFRDLRFFSKVASLTIPEFEVVLMKYLNKKYKEEFINKITKKFKPMKEFNDGNGCLTE